MQRLDVKCNFSWNFIARKRKKCFTKFCSMNSFVKNFVRLLGNGVSRKIVFEIYWPLLKWCPIFDSSPVHQFSKFNNFLWACWFLGKNISNFVSLDLKLHNRYCHNDAVAKGQLISEWCFAVLNFPTKKLKNLVNFYPRD